jgi:hypothetical protein
MSWSMCASCRAVAVALGCAPVPVTPIAVVTAGDPIYRALRQYKSGEPEVARRQSSRLAHLVDAFMTMHRPCATPDGADVTVVVPSCTGGRPAPHPLARVVSGCCDLPPLDDALAAGPGAVGHRRPDPCAYRSVGDVAGKRVLLLDDVYTSGAHLQSAAVVLRNAGAAAVGALVIGRFVGTDMTQGRPRTSRSGSRCWHCDGAVRLHPG